MEGASVLSTCVEAPLQKQNHGTVCVTDSKYQHGKYCKDHLC